MCGRYTLSTVDGPEIAQRFSLINPPSEETLGRFNVCPTETVAAIVAPGEATGVQWGLRPFKNGSFAPINVRSETASKRFKWLMDRGRCLVLADGWYEWLKAEQKGQPKLPFRYTVDDGSLFAFAGVYDRTGVAILTTEANEICKPVHDRMPVILDGPEAEAMWLSKDVAIPEAEGLLIPFPSERVSVAPANPAVNRAGVEGPELLTPPDAPPTPPSDTLF
ncbi:putative SOS response-associated peptidase YedK [Solirubrobacter pauli]|uniref:Abasic site processing protein n=1 Tax=Solirubrobacter pauli TaxID=166793 RepID=A0A660L099_9ACTN|nr:SOS response-associated peptidase [Solirubrobacter pauli]RKQ87296.1 putative SOS response-associated peptidase YedK [Solirubrobacter pauli]